MTPPYAAPTAVVGIGASAGGLQACTEFFNALPPDTGMAFVIVQHMAAEHESHLSSLLARATPMAVMEVHDGPQIDPNCIYVIPPNRTLIITDGHLQLRERPPGLHLAVDIFFAALAQSHGNHAIGVVLSGTGGDGSRGVETIKAHGGITFAQDNTAQYSSMPESAINTGCVDFILSAREIAAEIGKLAAIPDVAFGSEPADSSGAIDDVVAILHERLQVDFSRYKTNTLHRRINRRMALKNLSNLSDYRDLLREKPEEVDALYQDILISVTNFFRDAESFEALKTAIYPRIAAPTRISEPVRVWIVGCSTGEEAYSLAISLLEYMEESKLEIPVSLFGTDVNGLSIERARRGFYPRSIAQDVSMERLRRFFTEVEAGYVVKKSIREMCIFAQHNALADPPFSRMDLVSCRNLLIYFQGQLQRQLLPKLHYALKASGILFLGASESISQYHELFDELDSKHKFYAKRGVVRRLEEAFPMGIDGPKSVFPAARSGSARSREAGVDRQRTADAVLLKNYAPAGALIDGDGEILQFRGDTTPYLTLNDGKASLNIFKLAREGLFATLKAALNEAAEKNAAARSAQAAVDTEEGIRTLSIRVIPVLYPSTSSRCYWILFEPSIPSPIHPESQELMSRAGDASGEKERRIALLTKDLAATREHLEATIESLEAVNDDLQSANEEIRSANEELQSSNEELETSKEEIQSSNEELTTVNEELRLRNNALDRANDDLNNLFSSVQMAVVMVWRDMRIRRFTPLAQQIFNIVPTDIGRPLGNMNHNLELDDLPQLLSDVIETGTGREIEVTSQDGTYYLLGIRPYRTAENTVDGATIVLVDINMLVQTQESLRNRVSELAAADRHKNEFLAILAHELRNPLAPLRNAAHVLKLAPADADVSAKARDLIERQVHHMSRLVSDLLDAARAANGQIQLQRERVDMRESAQRAAELLRPLFDSRNQTLIVDVSEEPVIVDGDVTRMEQIVNNLLNNAHKYTGPGGRIEVTVAAEKFSTDGPSAVVQVRDNGEGIDAELIPRLFELFTQADRSLAHSQGGLGIGLSLVRTLVEMHGGRVSAHSEGRGRGSTFTIRLPLALEKQSAIGPESAAPPPLGFKSQRVLIVDDSADIRESTSALLSMVGHEVATAATGQEALKAALAFDPTAVLLDIGLPDVSGYDVARQLRKMPRFESSLLIAVSGYDTPEARRQSLEAGFDHHLPKPVPLSDLEKLLGAG
ncbi:MAG TPA: chemotaxis protein CheB [Steroidobacteraceae bacterium]|jgi:two-component system CheB/CheR fusion protein|nr:chemotaxis protein CheB [Steroidobacteraceae bacterium]